MKRSAWRPAAAPATALLVLVVSALTLSACAQTGGAGPAALSVEAREFAFSPDRLTVRSGQPVTVTLMNAGTVTHDFSVMTIPLSGEPEAHASEPAGHDMGAMTEEPALHVAADAGTEGTIEFTASAAGSYEFYCTVAGHKEAGMVGTLVVEP
jgi:uncharacterized cupredoxin-like copper-binding protein